LGDPQGLGGDGGSRVVEGPHGVGEPFGFLADQAIRRDLGVVEIHLPGGRAVDAHLVLGLAERHAGVVRHHQEGGDPLGLQLRVAGGEHRVGVGDAGIGDEPLGPGEAESPISPLVGGFHGHGVGPAAGFGEAVRHLVLPAGDPAEQLALLVVGAGQHDRDGAEA
jgi:hypothetical protein